MDYQVRDATGSSVAQGDLVGLGDLIGFHCPQPLAEALASLPQQPERVSGSALRGGTLRIGPMFLDEMGLQGCRNFVGSLQSLIDGPVPCGVVNHETSIAYQRRPGAFGVVAAVMIRYLLRAGAGRPRQPRRDRGD
jgi:hypothetical protein